MRVLTLVLSFMIVLSLSVPTAAAQDALCGNIAQVGVVPWTVCVANTARDIAEEAAEGVLDEVPGVLCAAWWLIWGPNVFCPFS